MYRFDIRYANSQMVVDFFYKEEKIGVATLMNDTEALRLMWIEVEDEYKGRGQGTVLMNFITDNLLKENQNFQINVVDEDVLPFYFNFFEKRKIDKETIFDWVQDGDVHPEIHVPKGSLNIKSLNKLQRSP